MSAMASPSGLAVRPRCLLERPATHSRPKAEALPVKSGFLTKSLRSQVLR